MVFPGDRLSAAATVRGQVEGAKLKGHWVTGSGRPAARVVAWDHRTRVCADGSVVLGGAPWSVLRIAEAGRPFLHRLRTAGTPGLLPSPGVEGTLAEHLVSRGVVHPVITPRPEAGDPTVTGTVEVVVPAYGDPESLEVCLTALQTASPGIRVIVVDDASTTGAVAAVAAAHGAILSRHSVNRGPAAARNTGLREVRAPLVAFVDADCAVTPGWLEILAAHFADPRVAAVGPRIIPAAGSRGPLARFEASHSELDMGSRPQLVTHGGRLGYLPSAALLARRAALPADPFDERLRVGEDVDVVWRLIDEGALVRYEPAAVVGHRSRTRLPDWARRIVDYGTSAAELDRRHPGRLAPAQLSPWNVVAGALLLARPRSPVTGRRRPSIRLALTAAAGTIAVATTVRARALRASAVDVRVAPVVVARRLASDVDAAGHLLRREWWPIGWLALAAAPRYAVARAAGAAMLAAPVREWRIRRPDLDLPRYLVLHLAADAAYGLGVIISAVRSRHPAVLLPRVRARRAGSG